MGRGGQGDPPQTLEVEGGGGELLHVLEKGTRSVTIEDLKEVWVKGTAGERTLKNVLTKMQEEVTDSSCHSES